jgi:transposase
VTVVPQGLPAAKPGKAGRPRLLTDHQRQAIRLRAEAWPGKRDEFAQLIASELQISTRTVRRIVNGS